MIKQVDRKFLATMTFYILFFAIGIGLLAYGYIETGGGKALLIDFNYNHEPVEGTFPFPGVGPLNLLKESRMNHMGKMAFRWIYWNMLIKGISIPFVSATMSEKGKHFEETV